MKKSKLTELLEVLYVKYGNKNITESYKSQIAQIVKEEITKVSTILKLKEDEQLDQAFNDAKPVTEEKVYIDYLNKKKGFKQDRIKFKSYEDAVKWANKNFEKFNPDMIKYESVTEEAKRDYKDEYKKFQSSDKSKKYRAELNKYNRDKGTYGNGDGKDASHKGGKIVGFESESKNRGRAEKSRLKKEEKLTENKARFVRNHMEFYQMEIDSLKGQIAYSQDALRQKDIKDWEKKEFTLVLKDTKQRLKDNLKALQRIKKVNNV